MLSVSLQTVEKAVKIADGVSINIETYKEKRLKRVAKGKSIEIIKVVSFLHKKYRLRRIYFGTFFSIKGTSLENKQAENPLGEYRLYQAEFLIKVYGFSLEDFSKVFVDGNFSLNMDPKKAWDLANRELFPVEINKADYHLLLRVPGIGKGSAEEIISRCKVKRLFSLEDLKDIRNLKKILKYVTIDGRYYGKGL